MHGIIVGFGTNEFDEKPRIAQKIIIPIIDFHDCAKDNEDFENILSHRLFCGGYKNGSGVCDGDSGSGVIFLYRNRFYLKGIVSSSLKISQQMCNVYAYQVYTDVLKFLYWIKLGQLNENSMTALNSNVNQNIQLIHSLVWFK